MLLLLLLESNFSPNTGAAPGLSLFHPPPFQVCAFSTHTHRNARSPTPGLPLFASAPSSLSFSLTVPLVLSLSLSLTHCSSFSYFLSSRVSLFIPLCISVFLPISSPSSSSSYRGCFLNSLFLICCPHSHFSPFYISLSLSRSSSLALSPMLNLPIGAR